MIRFVCGCGRQLQAREEDVGKKAKCPSCEAVLTVPDDGDSARRRRRREDDDRDDRVSARRDRRRDHDDDYEEDDRDRPRRRRDVGRADQSSGKATASMVLGLLALCTLGLTAIPAIILGILALRQIGQSDGRVGGRGLAITGIVASCVSFILIAPIAVLYALLAPAVGKVRETAARQADANNLKQIGLAFHNFCDVHGKLPQAAAFRTRDGRPGLSWRVALLPYLNEDALYRRFRLDEPWDSPSNKPLVAQIPRVYLMPGQAADGSTYYQVFVGKSTLFEVPAGPPPPAGFGGGTNPLTGIRFPVDVPDGTSNTLLVATSRSPVPWTRPDDLAFELGALLPPLGGHQPGGFQVCMADGSFRWVPQNTPQETLRAMVTRNGGEIVNLP
jgi:hypothetical protein